MPSGRPLKRPSDAVDAMASLSESSLGPKAKQGRIERGPEDFSNVVKTKLQSYTRTGQACDRCKVRKIRCDALPEGCSHCTNQNLECYVTNRVTGRTERRGYLQQLEREKHGMLNHIRDLEKLLRSKGVEVHPWEWSYGATCPPGVSLDNMGNPVQDANANGHWNRVGSLWVKYHDPNLQSSTGHASGAPGLYSRYSLLETRPTEGYLGVLTDSAPLSSIKGTKLSILGTTVDVTSFDAPDMDEPPPGTPVGSPLYNKSLMAFLQSTLGVNPKLEDVELPSRQEAFQYAQWYFMAIHPFMPVLHQPSFFKFLGRIYDEPNFKPPTCELVTAHMVFAAIYFQYGVRNREDPHRQSQLNLLSNKHYHWSLSQFIDLASSNTVAAVQALTMIAIHARSFPKPGCSSVIANTALSRAIELNLHRGPKIADGGTTLENEVRKRVWWATLAMAVTLNGRLGRPMPITLGDFDVEFPVAIDDEYITDEGITDPSRVGECTNLVGLTAFKVVPLYMEMYSNIYCVRRNPERYVDVVRGLQEAMQAIENSLPDDLRIDKCKPGREVFALYTRSFCLEFYLCLRHPSACMTDDRDFCAENSRLCEETANKFLAVATSLRNAKSLDTTWYQLSVYVAAIFCTLVAHWERRFDTTPDEITKLRADMKMWMDVVYEMGVTLGPGAKVSDEIGTVIQRTIAFIEHDMNRKGAIQTHQQLVSHQTAPRSQRGLQNNVPGATREQLTTTSAGNEFGVKDEQRNAAESGNGYYNPGIPNPPPAAFAASAAYPNQSTGTDQGTNGGGMSTTGSYDPSESTQYLYTGTATNDPDSGVDQSATAANPLIAFASQAAAQVSATQPSDDPDAWRQPQDALAAAAAAAHAQAQAHAHGTNGWQDWAAAIAESQTDRYSANALLTLGASRPSEGNPGATGLDDGVPASLSADMGLVGSSGPSTHAGQWPLMLFHDGNGPVSGS